MRRERSWEEEKEGGGRRYRGWRGRRGAGKKELGFGQSLKYPSKGRNTFQAGKRKTLNGQGTKVSVIFNWFFWTRKEDSQGIFEKYDKEANILPVTTYLWWSMYINKCAHS